MGLNASAPPIKAKNLKSFQIDPNSAQNIGCTAKY